MYFEKYAQMDVFYFQTAVVFKNTYKFINFKTVNLIVTVQLVSLIQVTINTF